MTRTMSLLNQLAILIDQNSQNFKQNIHDAVAACYIVYGSACDPDNNPVILLLYGQVDQNGNNLFEALMSDTAKFYELNNTYWYNFFTNNPIYQALEENTRTILAVLMNPIWGDLLAARNQYQTSVSNIPEIRSLYDHMIKVVALMRSDSAQWPGTETATEVSALANELDWRLTRMKELSLELRGVIVQRAYLPIMLKNQEKWRGMNGSKQSNQEQCLSRREALKTLVAVSGVIALPNVPDKWQPPVVHTGILPPFAQTSAAFTISGLVRTLQDLNDCSIPVFGDGSSFTVSFDYNDPTGNVTSAAEILYTSDIAGILNTIPLAASFVSITGNASHGTIVISLCTRFGTASAITESLILKNAVGLESNQLTLTTTRPIGAQHQGVSSQNNR